VAGCAYPAILIFCNMQKNNEALRLLTGGLLPGLQVRAYFDNLSG